MNGSPRASSLSLGIGPAWQGGTSDPPGFLHTYNLQGWGPAFCLPAVTLLAGSPEGLWALLWDVISRCLSLAPAFTWEVKANDRAYNNQFKKKVFPCWLRKKHKVGRPTRPSPPSWSRSPHRSAGWGACSNPVPGLGQESQMCLLPRASLCSAKLTQNLWGCTLDPSVCASLWEIPGHGSTQ